jgi:hypothetical protein
MNPVHIYHGRYHTVILFTYIPWSLSYSNFIYIQGSYRCLKSLKVLENESSKIKDLKVLEFQ